MNHSWWLLPDFSLKRSRKFQADERLFSLSSVTSPAVLIVVLNVAEHHMLSGCPFSYCFQIMEFANFDPFYFFFAYRLMNIWLDEMVSFLCAPFLVEFKSAVAKETHADFQYSSYPCRWKRIWTRPFKGRKHPCKWAVSFRYNFWTLQSPERSSEFVLIVANAWLWSLLYFDRGKPKKGGRPGGRDGKRLRPSNDPDLDDEDDY